MMYRVTHKAQFFRYIVNACNLFITVHTSIANEYYIGPTVRYCNKFLVGSLTRFGYIKGANILTGKIDIGKFRSRWNCVYINVNIYVDIVRDYL
jgi:hypothetical protein